MMRWIINVLVNALLLIVIAGYFDAVHVRSIGGDHYGKLDFIHLKYVCEARAGDFDSARHSNYARFIFVYHQCDHSLYDRVHYGGQF